MPKTQLHIRADDKTIQQIHDLAVRWDTTITSVVSRAIDRMYREETTMKEHIKIQFSDDSLWGSEDPEAAGYDELASANRYAEMVEAALAEEYPNAEIEVIRCLDDRVEFRDETGYPDTEEAQAVDAIISEVYESWKWIVDAD